MNYTDRIKTLMKLNKLNQEQMAEKIGISKSSFYLKLNRKETRIFNVDEAISIAKILNVTLDQIFLAKEVTI